MGTVVLREITQCHNDEKVSVREIRNQAGVRRFMYTDHVIGLDEHLAWIQRLKEDTEQIVFVVFVNHLVTGIVSLTALDGYHKKSDWGFYLDTQARGGLGTALGFSFLNYAFDTLGLEKVNGEVIETNLTSVEYHLKFGFIKEGFRRSNIIKDNKRIGVHFLGLTKEDWIEKREALRITYQPLFKKFIVTIEAPAIRI